MKRRRAGAGALVVIGVLLVACGGGGSVATATPAPVAERVASTTDPSLAGRSIDDFAGRLLAAVAADEPADANLVVSPLSVATALAMVEPGAVGAGRDAIDDVLGIDDPDAFHASMNRLRADLDARTEAEIGLADAAYIQLGYPLTDHYLADLGRDYGPVLEEVDFLADPDAVGRQINQFVDGATHGRITDLLGDGDLAPDTVLALVDALYLQAAWDDVFPAVSTSDRTFTRHDGSTVTTPFMQGAADVGAGDGFRYASKELEGDLVVELLLPDEGRFDEVAAGASTLERGCGSSGAVSMPRFEIRTGVDLHDAYLGLGLEALYHQGNLTGIADDERLVLDRALHQAWIDVDEEGVEAAAATVESFVPVSGCLDAGDHDLVLDRPFLFRVVDTVSGAPLFVGRVMDPTAVAE